MTFRFRLVCAAFFLALVMLAGFSMRISAHREEMLDNLLALTGHLLIQPRETPFTDWEAVAGKVSKGSGVILASPIVEGEALMSSPSNASSVLVRGIRASDLIKLAFVTMNIQQGTLDDFEGRQDVVIGSRLSKQLSLKAGDTITLLAPRGRISSIEAPPRAKAYKIAAVIESGMPESALVFMPLMEAQSFFDRSGQATRIEVHLSEAGSVAAFRQRVVDAAGPSVFVIDWRQRMATYFETK
jgi:lipoprotein-releasing system permease protein